ncbi:hypothetical protein SMSP2_02962 [Limihaloglobus sulfuriphilus]|uniref:Uncharacterized protein n=1 Tax=Limihaloglobus sulfuriphilus TaxID=1851148 RepID=A0A1Q2MJE0_9BACT|nr:hypothetical protein [Limihaloglobus sulfuriphilus]AQQ72572.1 hypothetical protein SMSP2_02962 [Limihaloglobus sulfuriphilus]
MSILVRKINRAKWRLTDKQTVADLRGDAVTSCLRTSGDKLSVWKFDDDDCEKIKYESILALMTGSSKNTIDDTIHVVFLNSKDLKEEGLELGEQKGDTYVKDLVDAHRNIENLNYFKLGKLAELILKQIDTKNVHRINSSKIVNLLINAIEQKRLEFQDLNENLQAKLIEKCKNKNIDIDEITNY